MGKGCCLEKREARVDNRRMNGPMSREVRNCWVEKVCDERPMINSSTANMD